MNLCARQRRRANTIVLALACAAPFSSAAEKLELPEDFPLWQKSAEVHAGFGYDDNVTLSSLDRQRSALALASVEGMLFRLPWNNWQLSLMAMGQDAHYLDRSVSVSAEQNAATSAEFTYFLAQDWKSVSTLTYTFLNEVVDVSATYGTSLPQQVRGHGLTAKQAVRKDADRWWMEIGLFGSREFVRDPLDSYYQAGLEATLGWYYRQGELSLTCEAAPLFYDRREQTDQAGAPLAGTELSYLTHTAELSWEHHLDAARRWRNNLRLSFTSNQDNGSGFYDYAQFQAGEQLRCRAGKWEFTAQVSVAYYDFPNQPLSPASSETRYRTGIRAGVRGERSLAEHWRLFVAYEYEGSLSNWNVEEYEANTVSAGLGLVF